MSRKAVVIYARVSTVNQTTEAQVAELKAYCQQRGWRDAEVITDCASGGTQSRAGLDRMMDLVRRGKIAVIVAYKLDRIGRSLAHLAQLIGELQLHGTALICPSQAIDTSSDSPVAALQRNLLGCFAEFERQIIVERVNAGLKAARQRGVKLGRPSKNAKHLPRIIELLQAHRCRQFISRELNLPRSTTGELIREAKAMMDGSASPASLP